MKHVWATGALVGLLIAGGCSSTDTNAGSGSTTTTAAKAGAAAYAGYTSAIYADKQHWICRGDVATDPCDSNLDATVVNADGSTSIERFIADPKPKIDCFYVYPTISRDQATSSDLTPAENEEIFVTRQQAARLGTHCRVFAPVYRQRTLTALLGAMGGKKPAAGDAKAAAEMEQTYGDVVDAFKSYMANDNGGRGVVLIGHSQGAGLLAKLVKAEIDPSPDLRGRLVSAILLGTSVTVPEGADVGGDFAHIVACRSATQTGCVITYSSFRDNAPPPANSYFGRGRPLDGANAAAKPMALCTNPASLSGGSGDLVAYLPTSGQSLLSAPATGVGPKWLTGKTITTPFVKLPKFVSAQCATKDPFSYLALTVHGDPTDPRIDDIGGDLTPEWGMHLVDANIAMGNLVDIVGKEAGAYRVR